MLEKRNILKKSFMLGKTKKKSTKIETITG